MRRTICNMLAALALTCAAMPAWAGSCDPAALAAAARERAGVADVSSPDALSGFFGQVCESGLSPEPFVARAAEGLVKRVPVIRLVPVLSAELQAAARAAELIGAVVGDAPPSEIASPAGRALLAGVPADALTRYFSTFGVQDESSCRLGLDMLTMMHAEGYPDTLTLSILSAGFENGMGGEWRFFSRVVSLARARGIADDVIAREAVTALRAGEGVRAAMTRLGFTGRGVLTP